MKAIKICEKNFTKIENEIELVQKRCSARCITRSELIDAVAIAQKTLNNFLYKKDQIGLDVYIDCNAQAFANAYNGIPESTQIIVKKTTTGWTLTSVQRNVCVTKKIKIAAIAAKKEEITEFLTAKFY